jgi:MFS family permease
MSIVKTSWDVPESSPGIAATPSISMKRAAFSATIGNMLEFYDFTTYTFFAIQIGRTFFPTQSAYGSLMLSLATFGVGFVTRPVGAIVLGIYSDRAGRRPSMLLSFVLMGLALLVISLTPSYEAIGLAAPVVVIIARIVQGFALGGEVGPSTSYLLEIAPPRRRALTISLQPVSQALAGVAGALVGLILSATMTPAELQNYGWRIAFLIGAMALPFGFWMRRTLPETVPQTEDGAPRPGWRHHFTEARRHLRLIVLAMMVLANGTIATYVTKYITTYAQTTLHVTSAMAFATSLVSTTLHVVGTLLGAWLADHFGRKPMMIVPQLIVIVLTYPIFLWMVDARDAWSLLFGFGALSLVVTMPFSAFGATVTEALPQAIRAGVLGTVYAVTIASFGGTAQLVVTWLIHVLGNPLAPAWYLLLAAVVGLLAMIMLPETAPVKDGRQKRKGHATVMVGTSPGCRFADPGSPAASFAGALPHQLGDAAVGAAQPPAQLAVDVLYHQHIGVDVGLVAGVELSSRKLVQHGRTRRDDGGRSVLHLDQRHLAKEITRCEIGHVNDLPGLPAFADHEFAGLNDEHRMARLAFRHDGGAGIEAALDQHRDQEIEACVREATEERRGEQERFQIG